MKHTQKLERHIFKLSYTQRRLYHVERACAFILENVLKTDHDAYFALVSSIHCNYAALFTQAEGNLGAVTEKIVNVLSPDEKALHELIILLRNKVFAHVDPTIEGKMPSDIEVRQFAYRLNEVRVSVRLDGREQSISHSVSETRPLPIGIAKIKALVETVRKVVDHELKATLFKRYKANATEGDYVINGKVFSEWRKGGRKGPSLKVSERPARA
ncbi:MAG TPA: hypothetical protein VIK52_14440 [Opitutaceae bacterium]